MIQSIIVGVVCLIMGALLSFFITTLTQRKMFNGIAKEITIVHEKVHHRKSQDTAIQDHIKTCQAYGEHKAIKAGIIFLVTKQNGNLHDLGLTS